MAAPSAVYQGKDKYTMTLAASGAGTLTLDMPVPPAASLAWVIDAIYIYCVGTITAFHVDVTTAAGGEIVRVGGQVGGATNGSLPAHIPIPGPIVCLSGDQTKVVVVATGASSVKLSVSAHHEAGN